MLFRNRNVNIIILNKGAKPIDILLLHERHTVRYRTIHSRHLCSTKKLQNRKAQDVVALCFSVIYISCFWDGAEYLNLGAAFS